MTQDTKEYYVPLPDNEYQFYAFVNLVINNKNNTHITVEETIRPKRIGWVHVTYTRNEVNEPFVVVNNLKEKCFVEMIRNQFELLKQYWDIIKNY